MGNTESIRSAEIECEVTTELTFPEILNYYEELYTIYLNISENNCKQLPNGKVQRPLSIFFLNDRILKSLFCVFELLKKGHYNEGRSIQRDILEAICVIEYILEKPEESTSWFSGQQLKFSRIRKAISLPEGDDVIYGHLCDFTHPNMHSSVREHELVKSEGVFFSYTPYFQRNIAHSSFILLIVHTNRAMKNYIRFIEKYHQELNYEDKHRLQQNARNLEKIQESLNINYQNDN